MYTYQILEFRIHQNFENVQNIFQLDIYTSFSFHG